MAKVSILGGYNKKNGGDGLYSHITECTWLVDIDFETEDVFRSYLEAGFDPSRWERKNSNKVLISGISYREYLNNKHK